jgi:pyruvoyl-dependent arginine decarboxylase (PvlArgDC)
MKKPTSLKPDDAHFSLGVAEAQTKLDSYDLAFLQFCFEDLEVVFQLVSIFGIV